MHAPRVDVRAHARVVVERLQLLGTASFRVLCAGCTETIEIVARFLALLELGREGRVSFDQPVALGELTVRWIPPGAEGLHADFQPDTPSEFDDEPEPVE